MTITETAKALNRCEKSVWLYIERGLLPKPVKIPKVITHKMLIADIPDEAVHALKQQLGES